MRKVPLPFAVGGQVSVGDEHYLLYLNNRLDRFHKVITRFGHCRMPYRALLEWFMLETKAKEIKQALSYCLLRDNLYARSIL